MKLNLTFGDFIIVVSYYILISSVGFLATRRSRKNNNQRLSEFLVAGRKLTLPLFVASLVATWYGNILGIGEFVYRNGIVAWFCFGIVYYISALVFAFLISSKIREFPYQTIPELIESKFGKTSGFFATVVLLLITFPSVYILMVGTFINAITGLNHLNSLIIGTIICFIYIGYGGFKTNVITNSIQFVLMYIGFGIFTFFSLKEIGYELFQLQKLPHTHLKFFGDLNWQYIISWFFISLQTFIDPSFYQRCTSAKNSKTARNGILISILFWIAFDTMTVFIGLVAKHSLTQINPLFAYPLLLEKIVPPVFKGIVFISMLATIISTLESYTFLSAIFIGKNIFQNFGIFSTMSLEKKVRIGILITGIFSIGLSNFIPSAIDIIYKTSSIVVPSLFFPVILSYITKPILKIKQVNILIISSTILTIIFLILKEMNIASERIIFYILSSFEPMVLGFLWASLCFLSMLAYNKFTKSITTNILA